MTHKAFILDDDEDMAVAIEQSIRSEDRDVTVVSTRNARDAKDRLDGHCSEYLYGIVDLHLSNDPSRNLHGEAFLDWLDSSGWLQRVSVLVVSSYQDRLDSLPRNVAKYVTVKKKSASYADNSRMIRQFIEKVLAQPRAERTAQQS